MNINTSKCVTIIFVLTALLSLTLAGNLNRIPINADHVDLVRDKRQSHPDITQVRLTIEPTIPASGPQSPSFTGSDSPNTFSPVFARESPPSFRGNTQGFSQDSPPGFGRDTANGFTRDSSSGFTRDKSQSFTRDVSHGLIRDNSPGFIRDKSQGFTRDTSPGLVQDSSEFTKDKTQDFIRDSSPVFNKDKSQSFTRDSSSGFNRDTSSKLVRDSSPGFTKESLPSFTRDSPPITPSDPSPSKASDDPSSSQVPVDYLTPPAIDAPIGDLSSDFNSPTSGTPPPSPSPPPLPPQNPKDGKWELGFDASDLLVPPLSDSPSSQYDTLKVDDLNTPPDVITAPPPSLEQDSSASQVSGTTYAKDSYELPDSYDNRPVYSFVKTDLDGHFKWGVRIGH